MEDSMIDMPNLVFDEKIAKKRVRDGEEEIHIKRLEKRPSGILGVSGDEGGEVVGSDGDSGGGIIDTFISNVFHKNKSGIEGEEEDGGQVKSGVEVEDKRGDLGVDGSEGHGGDGGGEGGKGGAVGGVDGGGNGIISAFLSNIFHHNESANDGRDQEKPDLLNEVVEKIDDSGGVGDNGEDGGAAGGELTDLSAEKLAEKNDTLLDLPSKDLAGHTLKMKPDDYSERVFFLNNN